MSISMKRMWFDQPSTLQPFHHLHGVHVLLCDDTDKTYRVYFLSGDIHSMQVPRNVLSPGWPERYATRSANLTPADLPADSATAEAESSLRTIVVEGVVNEDRGYGGSDSFAVCAMEVAVPYPHVVHFYVVSKGHGSVQPIVARMHQAKKVQIVCDVIDEHPGFDAYDGRSPALETDPDRITIVEGPDPE